MSLRQIITPDGASLQVEVTGRGPTVMLLHAGGPDRHSLDPFAAVLAERYTVIQPDIRGYGASICRDPGAHTWTRYTEDVVTVLGDTRAILIGTGLGATIALRTARDRPEQVAAVVVLGLEDIEDDEAKAAEIALLDDFARQIRLFGLAAAWEPILQHLPPAVGTLVREAIPRSDPESIAAAAHIGHDRSFRSVDDLAAVHAPTLIFAGTDPRHPRQLAEQGANLMPNAQLATTEVDATPRTAQDLADTFLPELNEFLSQVELGRG